MLELFRAIFAPPRDLILLVAAGWVGLALADRRARRTAVAEKGLDTLVGALVLAFLIGGRVLYAAAHLSAFISSPASLISLNVGLFDQWAGIAAAVVAAAAVLQRKQLPAWQALDLLAPFLAALGVGLALSHLASGSAFGKATNVPWAIDLWGAQRHPTQVYELLAGFVTLGVVWFSGARGSPPGKTFLLWASFAAASRLLVEGFRGDSTLIFGGLRLAQIIAWVVLALALIGLELLQHRDPQEQPLAHEDERDTGRMTPTDKEPRAAPDENGAR